LLPAFRQHCPWNDGKNVIDHWAQFRLSFAVFSFLLAQIKRFLLRKTGIHSAHFEEIGILVGNWMSFAFLTGRAQVIAVESSASLT
jgi:hypothetical protein